MGMDLMTIGLALDGIALNKEIDENTLREACKALRRLNERARRIEDVQDALTISSGSFANVVAGEIKEILA